MKENQNNNKHPTEFPMRINKYLAFANYSTRRGGDELVEKHLVFINGKKANHGDTVNENDTVKVRGIDKKQDYVYFAYNKQIGVVTSSPQGDEKDIKEAVKNSPELNDSFPVGRLDKNSHGLIILTNDGRVTDRLLNPIYEHDKEYRVETREKLRNSFATHMESGVDIEDEQTRPCTVKIRGDKTFTITLSEGKKHQIRRMVSAMHNEVSDLERIRIMNISLRSLRRGSHRLLKGDELNTFLTSLRLKN